MSTLEAPDLGLVGPEAPAGWRHGAYSVYLVEWRKLRAQLAIRLLALVCVLAPFLFGAILRIQSGSPTDTLYGVWVHSSGFAVSLLVLSFAGAWGFPVVAGIVAGDIFSAEDRYGTWKLVLTRSCTRGEVFVGKVLAAGTASLALLTLSAVSSLLAGVLLIGDQSLVSLSGTVLSPGRSLGLAALSWLLCAAPTLALASLAVLLSIATRNGIIGVIGPGLAALAMQLLLLVGAGIWAHMLLVDAAFGTWHALFTAHPFYGPLLIGITVCVIWTAACLTASWLILRGRDFAGPAVARRQGWLSAARLTAPLAAVVAFFAIASNWGPVGVTASRLTASLVPAFNRLTLLQQEELGRPVPPGAKLEIVVPSCSRRGSTPTGPGDWVCTINVLVPTASSLPPQPMAVTYDVSVNSDGCYKAQSPPAFVGSQLMRDAQGNQVVNPLYTIYGCFNPM